MAPLRTLLCLGTAACMVSALGSSLRVSPAAPPLAQQAAPRDRPSPAATGTGSISGRVLVRGQPTPAPVRRARVTLRSEALPEPRATDTGTDGRYRFDNLPAGQYRVRAEKPGYVGLEYGATRPFVQAAPLEVGEGQARTADISLPRGAALEGRILTEDGEPVQDATVSAMRLAYGPRGRRPEPVGQARTDDLGRFRVHSLPAGNYYLQMAPSRLDALDRQTSPGERPAGYAHTFYPGTARVDEARTVTLVSGQEIGQLDFTPQIVPTARITVDVLDASGRRPASASCRLQPVSGVGGTVSGFGDPRTSGSFQFPAAPPGQFWLTAAAMPAAGGDPEYAATRLTVSGEDLPALTIRTARGATLTGAIEVDADGAPLSLAGLQVLAHEAEFELPNPAGPASGTTIAASTATANGRFTILSLFGPRLLRTSRLPQGWALKAVWLDEQEITDSVYDFRAGDQPRTLRLVITNRTGSVAGTVTGERGRPVGDARVVVFADDERRWGLWSRFVRSAAVSAEGRFKLEGLLPGDYLVCAVESLEDDAWTDPSVLRGLRPMAVPLAVAERASQTLTLTLRALQ